jgi:hypothetical protein
MPDGRGVKTNPFEKITNFKPREIFFTKNQACENVWSIGQCLMSPEYI